jgi:SAM-dependent methyltransferase
VADLKNSPRVVMFLVMLGRTYMRYLNPFSFLTRSFIRRMSRISGRKAMKFETCIDIGAGVAPYEGLITEAFAVSQYVAMDFVPSDRISVAGDSTRLPLCSEIADLVVSFEVIQHVTSPTMMLQEIRRVLNPGGSLILTFPFLYPECDVMDFRRWTLDGMCEILRNNGFEVVVAERRGGAAFAFTCWITWMLQHIIPRSRRSWRSGRDWYSVVRAALRIIMGFIPQQLGWIALTFDRLAPSDGVYMGVCILARKSY